MLVERLAIPDVLLITPKVWPDDRGYFFEAYRDANYAPHGLPTEEFCQDNISFSKAGVLRGLHAQNPLPQAKLVQVLSGEIWDVAVDIRPASPTFGQWVAAALSAANHAQLFIPRGFAHGFLVTGDHALVNYKVAGPYKPEHEFTLLWNDPDLAISWPHDSPLLSGKDAAGLTLEQMRQSGRI